MHEGHRRRLIDKFMVKRETISDHELLEIILFYAIPRKNTNEISHNLLDSFGSLDNIFKSDAETLTSVEGIGMKTAEYLTAIGYLFERSSNKKTKLPELLNFETCKPVLKSAFKNASSEFFIALFLDKDGNFIFRKTFCSHLTNKVEIDLNELVKGVNSLKPDKVIISHNHLSGIVNPSEYDDKATMDIYNCLSLFKIKLADHIIVSNNSFYSYYSSGRLDSLIRKLKSFKL